MSRYNSNWIERNTYYEMKPTEPGQVPHYIQYQRPLIVVLCGSCRFKEAYIQAQQEETLSGKIVLSVGMFMPQEQQTLNPEVKVMLDNLHMRKIDLADEVLILNVGGYIGTSTRNELEYARRLHKPIRFLEEIK